MPPKRKRAEAEALGTAEASPTARSTRSSTRQAASQNVESGEPSKRAATRTSSAKESPKKAQGGGEGATETPAAKKTKTTAKATAASSSAKAKPKTSKASVAKTASDAMPDPSAGTSKPKSTKTPAKSKSKPESSKTTTSNADERGSGSSKTTGGEAGNGPSKPKVAIEPYSASKTLQLFDAYTDPDDANVIGPEGYERLCTDAEVPMDGALPLILAWQLDAQEMAKLSREEWTKGTEALQISSLPPLSIALREMNDLIVLDNPPLKRGTSKGSKDPYRRDRYWRYAENKKKAFGELYGFCFQLVKTPESRNIDMDTASAFWSVLLGPRYPIVAELVDFVNCNAGKYKAVNKDLWSMTLEFCQTVTPNLDNYEDDGAWPTLLDDFVSWKKAKDQGPGQASPSTNADAE